MTRVLFVAWQDPHGRGIYPVARLAVRERSPQYEFGYIRGVEDAQRVGFLQFARMKKLDALYFADELFPLFTNRLMPSTRRDYPDYLRRLGLMGDSAPIVVLARSEGRKATDNLELFAPPERDNGRWVYHAFARGVRHLPCAERRLESLSEGDLLEVEPEKDNEWDPRALLIRTAQGIAVGYVPYTLVEDLGDLRDLGSQVETRVVRLNASPAPVHQRLLVSIAADHVRGFSPLSTERYQPISSEATPLEFVHAMRP